MPIYEYVCEACGRITECMQRVADPPPPACPECGDARLARLVSRTTFQLKGGGWYKDLYSGSKSEGGGTSKPTSDAPAASTPSPSTGGAAPSHAPNKKPDTKT